MRNQSDLYMKSLRESKARRVMQLAQSLNGSANSAGRGSRGGSGGYGCLQSSADIAAAAGTGVTRSVGGKTRSGQELCPVKEVNSNDESEWDGNMEEKAVDKEISFRSETDNAESNSDTLHTPSPMRLEDNSGRRVGMIAATGSNAMTAWRELVLDSLHADLDEVDLDDDSEVEAVCHRLPIYAPPMQRQKWGEDQMLPHINWGDLFFDLFYVAAAYNLGALLISAMTPDLWFHGVVYFVGIFGPLFNTWESKLVYDARYSVIDYTHRLVEVARVFCLSISVLHIKPIELMSDPRSAETFGFTLGLLLECVIRIFLKLELITVGKGDKEAIRNHSGRKLIVSYIPLTLFYLAAVIVSGVGFYNQDDPNKGHGSSEYGDDKHYADKDGDSYNSTDAKEAGYETDGHDDGHHRMLAETDPVSPLGNYSTDWSTGDIPIILCAVAYLLNLLFTTVRKTIWLPHSTDFRKENVPSNIDFCIHRYGEWTMLMLGEAVLSLLIVETTEDFDYYFVALAGVLTVIFIQVLHFESEPSHADHHALWRNMQAGMWYSVWLQLLSMSLITFGVSYKVMLKGIHKDAQYASKESDYGGGSYDDKGDDYDGGHRWLIEDTFIGGEGGWGSGFFGLGRRYLAGSVAVTDQAAAALFCGSLTIVLVSLELLTNLHRGMHENAERLIHQRDDGMILRLEIFFLTVFKVGIILFLATLSQWLNDPKWVALTGFIVVVCLAVTRMLGWNIVHGKKGKKKKKSNSDLVPPEVKVGQ